jgi:hypothetical protein
LHVDRFDAREFRDDILDAATTCKVNDPQIEGLRADWLAELCVRADLVESIVELPAAGSSWDRNHRCALLKEFASRGHARARAELYAACVRDQPFSNVFGLEEIVALDGEEGLVFAARKLGSFLRDEADFWVDNGILLSFDESREKGRADEILRARAPGDDLIRRYLEGVADTAAARGIGPSPARKSVEAVVSAITTSNEKLYWLGFWGRRATLEELTPILHIALTSSTTLVLENALRGLSQSDQLPLEPRLFDLLRHDDPWVRYICAQTLGHHVDPRVRAEGRSALGRDLSAAVMLLHRNATAEDGGDLAAALHPIADPDDQHTLVYDLLRLADQCPEVREPLLGLYVYEYSPCMNCRERATRLLDAAHACPPWLLEEGIRDAAEEIRRICSTSMGSR